MAVVQNLIGHANATNIESVETEMLMRKEAVSTISSIGAGQRRYSVADVLCPLAPCGTVDLVIEMVGMHVDSRGSSMLYRKESVRPAVSSVTASAFRIVRGSGYSDCVERKVMS